MPRSIPECPVFQTVTVCGVEHTLTPSPRGLDSFLNPVLQSQNLRSWSDLGADDMMSAVKEWWPEEVCPVETTITDDSGDETEYYQRWPGLSGYSLDETKMASLVADHPEDADEIRAYFRHVQRQNERTEALEVVRQALQALGVVRRRHILDDVVADLNREMPGYLQELVSGHCSDGHKCSRAEHEVDLD